MRLTKTVTRLKVTTTTIWLHYNLQCQTWCSYSGANADPGLLGCGFNTLHLNMPGNYKFKFKTIIDEPSWSMSIQDRISLPVWLWTFLSYSYVFSVTWGEKITTRNTQLWVQTKEVNANHATRKRLSPLHRQKRQRILSVTGLDDW
jgi:hypothetical protein